MYQLIQCHWEYKSGSEYPTWIPDLILERDSLEDGKLLMETLSNDIQENSSQYDESTAYFQLVKGKTIYHYISKKHPGLWK